DVPEDQILRYSELAPEHSSPVPPRELYTKHMMTYVSRHVHDLQGRAPEDVGRRSRKNARISAARACGSSSAAKWPPAAIGVRRRTSNTRSAHARGGRTISRGNAAWPIGTSTRAPSGMGQSP